MKKTVEKLLNDQLTLEFAAAYSYLGMAAYFESIDYGGGAHWMKCQSKEEMHHFHKITLEYPIDLNINNHHKKEILQL